MYELIILQISKRVLFPSSIAKQLPQKCCISSCHTIIRLWYTR